MAKRCNRFITYCVDNVALALNGQDAENQFVSCNCGIMDQLMSALGKDNHALLIDCRTLGTRAVPMPDNVAVVIVNSNVKRGLLDSERNARHGQCKTGARFFAVEEFEAVAHGLNDTVAKRMSHVLSENMRMLVAGDLRLMGHLLADHPQ